MAGARLRFGFLLNTALAIEHSVDNTDVLIVGEKCLDRTFRQAFSAFCTVGHAG